MKKKNYGKKIVSAIITIVLSLVLMTGSTLALFGDNDQVDVAVKGAKVSVSATLNNGSLKAYSYGVLQTTTDASGAILLENGGRVSVTDEGNILVDRITPADKITFDVDVVNESNVSVKYKVKLNIGGELASALTATADGVAIVSGETDWAEWNIAEGNEKTVKFVIELPESVNDDYQEKEAVITYAIEVIQLNAKLVDKWDGSIDTSWYNDEDTEFSLSTAEQLAGLSELLNGTATFALDDLPVSFDGKTIKLESDVDLFMVDENGNIVNFDPIGHSKNGVAFTGVFDGQGYTIKNMNIRNNLDAWQYEGEYYGLFAYTEGAEIKNVTIENATICSGRNEAACIVGNAVDTKFSNITIKNSDLIAYNNSAGGIAAECYGECSFTDIVIDEDTVVHALWNTHDVRLGGVVGMLKSSDKATFSNITVACKLDAYNDVGANYQYWLYRYCGMLIGQVDGVNGVADPTGYVTCENVTVIYDDWVNYHYCEFESLGAGSYNGPGEYKYQRVEGSDWGSDTIDTSSCNHSEDESHNVLIVFDQLFGGGQGVSGLKTYAGVDVIYKHLQ